MKVGARPAVADDIPALENMYKTLELEMTALHPMWPRADGLRHPIADSLRRELELSGSLLMIGTIDDHPFGFLLARVERMLGVESGEEIGSIRLIFVEAEAREVGVGEAMRDETLSLLRERGLTKFDAHVLPGHRLAKNFFESGGFSARSIVMHRDDDRER